MKPITKPIAVSVHAQSDYSAVLDRLHSMGFKHASGYSRERIMSDWEDYPVFDISRPASGVFSRNAVSAHFSNVITAAQFLAEYGSGAAAPAPATTLSNCSVLCISKEEYSDTFRRLFLLGYRHTHGQTSVETLSETFGRPVGDEDFIVIDTKRKEFSRDVRARTGYPRITYADFIEIFIQHMNQLAPCNSGVTPTPTEPSTPTPPLNPPNFYIDTGDTPALRKIVQELAFDAGIAWGFADKSLASFPFRYVLVVREADKRVTRSWRKNTLYTGSPNGYPDIPVYSAATQMGEIVRLFSTPVEPPVPPAPTPPELYGYKAVYTPGAPTVDFGCAKLGKNLLRDAAKLMGCVIDSDGSVMKNAGVCSEDGCNRSVESVTLCSGKTLSRNQIKEILGYVAAVEEYAKKYPQKSS
jgi:hypothetical protein